MPTPMNRFGYGRRAGEVPAWGGGRHVGLRVVGAGVGRTGTLSLKGALELVLGGSCYHMMEVFSRPDDVAMWTSAATGGDVDWTTALEGYTATTDFPACLFWRELSDL